MGRIQIPAYPPGGTDWEDESEFDDPFRLHMPERQRGAAGKRLHEGQRRRSSRQARAGWDRYPKNN